LVLWVKGEDKMVNARFPEDAALKVEELIKLIQERKLAVFLWVHG